MNEEQAKQAFDRLMESPGDTVSLVIPAEQITPQAISDLATQMLMWVTTRMARYEQENGGEAPKSLAVTLTAQALQ